jgi:transmembrane sensor
MDSDAIEAAAAEWVIQRFGEAWTEADQQKLDSWLKQSTLHRVTYLRLEFVWQQTARLKALAAGTPASVVPPPGSLSSAHLRGLSTADPGSEERVSSSKRWLALAAGLVLAFLGGTYWLFSHLQATEMYVTGVGGLQTVRLADGSEVTLNTNTHLRAYLRGKERRIELDSGEAYFVVTKDPSRPFVIHVADKTLVALGTQFSVQRMVSDVQVLVTAGRVELRLAGTPQRSTILDADTLARTVNSEVVIRHVSKAEAEQFLSWRGGFLTFRDTPLSDAVAQFNRFQVRKLVIEDPSLATIRIGGKFRTNNLSAFLSLLQQGFPVTVEETDDRIVLKRRT